MNSGFSFPGFILAGIRKKPGRNLACAFCFAFIAVNIFSAQYLLSGAAEGLDAGASKTGADLLVIPAEYVTAIRGTAMGPVTAGSIIRVEPSTFRLNASLMDQVARSPDVAAASPQLYAGSLADPVLSSGLVDVYGIDPVTDFTIKAWLETPLQNPIGSREIIAGSAITAGTGTTVRIGNIPYTVAGKLGPTRSGVDRSIFMTIDDARVFATSSVVLPAGTTPPEPGTVSAILVQVRPGVDQALAGAKIQQPLPMTRIRVLEKHAALQPASQVARGLPGILTAISAIIVLAALPLVGLIAAMAAHERQQEIGLLISMGARRPQIFFLVLGESFILAFAGGIAGIITGVGLFSFLNRMDILQISFLQGFEVPMAGDIAVMAVIALGIVILVGTLAALWPAWQSSRMNPYDAIRESV